MMNEEPTQGLDMLPCLYMCSQDACVSGCQEDFLTLQCSYIV